MISSWRLALRRALTAAGSRTGWRFVSHGSLTRVRWGTWVSEGVVEPIPVGGGGWLVERVAWRLGVLKELRRCGADIS